jgi:hypothetical protein
MEDGAKPSERNPAHARGELRTLDDLLPVWADFRAGRVVACAKDTSPMALAVDAGAGAYRFVCVACGNSSPWFESGPAGTRIRGGGGMSTTSTLTED